MNSRNITIWLAALLALLAMRPATASAPQDAIIVNNADEVLRQTVLRDEMLINTLNGVVPRVVVEYSNTVRRFVFPALPSGLQTRLNQAVTRVVVEHANAAVLRKLLIVTAPLQARLDQVTERVVFQYANANLRIPLIFPAQLVCDGVPPHISDLHVTAVTANTATVVWTTDTFADSFVRYGLQSGQYPSTAHDPLYYKSHSILLTGLTPEATYHLRVRSTDLCGNPANSSELSFATSSTGSQVYLPLVLRRH
jgi:hypothetical protein